MLLRIYFLAVHKAVMKEQQRDDTIVGRSLQLNDVNDDLTMGPFSIVFCFDGMQLR